MGTLNQWKHPGSGRIRIYCAGAGEDRKVWIEERPSEPSDFAICKRGRFRVDEDVEIAQDCLRSAGLDLSTTTFRDILGASQ